MTFSFRADFQGAILREADLRGANLRKANLTGVDLTGARLGVSNIASRTQLQGATLIDAKVSGADFTGAEYDSNTRFPAGFLPAEHGMVETETEPDD
jgi:uncharacterized protein YjbI with pentapeptide repeats